MKIVQLITNSGGKMRKVIKKSPIRKSSPTTENKPIAVELTASQRRILQVVAMGTETEEPSLLAGRP